MEVLAIAGGIASIAQLLEIAGKICGTLITLVEKLQNVPEELRRQLLTLRAIRARLQLLQNLSKEAPIEHYLPTLLWQEFQLSLLEVQRDIEIVAQSAHPYETGKLKISSMRDKFRYRICNEKTLAKAMDRLRSSETNLERIESTVHLGLTYLAYSKTKPQHVAAHYISGVPKPFKTANIIRRSRSSLLPAHSFLRRSGVYVWLINEQESIGSESRAILCVGFCIFLWSTLCSISLELSICNALHRDGWTLQSKLRVRKRVPINSPLMGACQQGDVLLIRQILEQKRGGLTDQSMCSGKTALIIAIESRRFEAVKCLLQLGADPNISDDDQVTPLFAVAGMKPREHEYFEQLPPTWDLWLDTFRLLAEYGASLDETVRGRNVANLNVVRNDQPIKTLEYLRLLAAQDCLQFDAAIGDECWSALRNALCSRSDAVDALKILSSTGVDLPKVMDDGRTALHLAAQWCLDSKPLEYLYSVGCRNLINKQDRWGWTALHYAAIARNSALSSAPYSKVVSLLREKADVKIEGGENPRNHYDQPGGTFTPYELLSFARPSRSKLLMQILQLQDQDYSVEGRVFDEVFYDAQEEMLT